MSAVMDRAHGPGCDPDPGDPGYSPDVVLDDNGAVVAMRLIRPGSFIQIPGYIVERLARNA